MNPHVKDLWETHCSGTFPKDCCGHEIEGIDLALLDTETAGCIQTFIANKGSLDLQRTAILGLCYRDLTIVVGKLGHEGKAHFARLEEVSRLVLSEIASNRNSLSQ
jgi:hypothetical protein